MATRVRQGRATTLVEENSDVLWQSGEDHLGGRATLGMTELVTMLLPAFAEEGKSHFSIGFGCTGGQHRSVVIAEKLANALAASGWQVSKRHRELERRGVGGAISTAKTEGKT